jgi:hypothetical protein
LLLFLLDKLCMMMHHHHYMLLLDKLCMMLLIRRHHMFLLDKVYKLIRLDIYLLYKLLVYNQLTKSIQQDLFFLLDKLCMMSLICKILDYR